jgi:hypothetical protein
MDWHGHPSASVASGEAPGSTNGLNGNIFPGSTSVPGYVLENTDGVGTLSWAALPAAPLVSDGVYTPVITIFGDADLVPNNTLAHWTRVGNSLTIAGSFLVDLRAGGISMQVTIPVPSFFRVDGTGGIGSQGSGSQVNNHDASEVVITQATDWSTTAIIQSYRSVALTKWDTQINTLCNFNCHFRITDA